MEFDTLLRIIENEPVFDTGLLLAGAVDPFDVRKQLSRWTTSGKLYQLRRGLYCLAPPYQKSIPHPFLVANRLIAGSYVSLQSALAYYSMIPEFVPMTTSVTTARPITFRTPFGNCDFRHIQVSWFHSYHRMDLGNGQWAFIATPEKALLDLVYLQEGGGEDDYLRSLRLQALHQLDMVLLQRLSSTANKPKLIRAVKNIQHLVEEDSMGYQPL